MEGSFMVVILRKVSQKWEVVIHDRCCCPFFINLGVFRYVNLYAMPEQRLGEFVVSKYTSADLLANFIIDENYVAGMLVGRSKVYDSGVIDKLGMSATLVVGGFRLGYSFQHNSRNNSGVALPVHHILSVGYDFLRGEDAKPRFF